jgi:VCBS repeat-containing protein
MKKNKNIRIVNIMLLVTAMLIWIAGPAQAQITKYTDEDTYLAALANLGYSSFKEGFENDAVWGSARSFVLVTNSAPSITSMGITWTSNHPDTNEITTSSGAARSGDWGIYDRNHGHATGSVAQCDVDTPPAGCFFHDGVSGTIEPGTNVLHGVGGWVRTNTPFARINIILDNTTTVDFENIPLGTTYLFFGVIDTNGFNSFEIRETEGAVGDEKFIFADDFTFGAGLTPGNTPPVANNNDYATNEGTELSIAAPGVLGNDTDADGDALTAILNVGPSNGTLTLNSDGSFTYTPNAGFTGLDTFTYHANDGLDDSNIATVTITVNPLNDSPVVNDALPAIYLLLLN